MKPRKDCMNMLNIDPFSQTIYLDLSAVRYSCCKRNFKYIGVGESHQKQCLHVRAGSRHFLAIYDVWGREGVTEFPFALDGPSQTLLSNIRFNIASFLSRGTR
jgi:hypothetical protein